MRRGGGAASALFRQGFELVSNTMTMAPYWEKKLQNGTMTQEEIKRATKMYDNVVTQYEFLLKVIK